MSLNKPDRDKIVKEAEKRGYSWNSDGSKLTNRNGGWGGFSESGGSFKTKDRKFTNPSDANKSGGW